MRFQGRKNQERDPAAAAAEVFGVAASVEAWPFAGWVEAGGAEGLDEAVPSSTR